MWSLGGVLLSRSDVTGIGVTTLYRKSRHLKLPFAVHQHTCQHIMEITSEYSEISTVTFEWTLRGLKNLFDTTKGDKKSKVTKSIRFGNDKWQVCT